MNFRAFMAAPGAIRIEEHRGKEFIVVPIVALVEGVIQCATCPTPELALASEFGQPVEAWNGRPVTFRHPTVAGIFPIPAGDPATLEAFQIGTVFNAELDEGKLKLEAWLDPELVAAVDGAEETLERIRDGEQVEVSTGFFADTIEANGTFEGKEFEAIQRNIKPDHLAILDPESVGACSWQDGCGAPRVNSSSVNSNSWILTQHTSGNTSDFQFRLVDPSPYLVPACQCQHDEPAEESPAVNKEKQMDRERTIAGLIANAAVQFEESDREWLESLEDEQLARLVPNEVEPERVAPSVEDLEAFAAENGLELRQPTPEPSTRDEWLARAPESIRDDLNELARIRENNKAKLVAKVKTHEKNPFTDAQLAVKSIEELESLVAFIGDDDDDAAEPQNFGGRPPVTEPETNSAPPAPNRWDSEVGTAA